MLTIFIWLVKNYTRKEKDCDYSYYQVLFYSIQKQKGILDNIC